MDPLLSSYCRNINRISFGRELIILLIRLVRSLMLALVLMALWAFLDSQDQRAQLTVGLISFFALLIVSLRWKFKKISPQAIVKSLEINYPTPPTPAFHLLKERDENRVWTESVQNARKKFFYENFKMLSYHSSTLILPAILWAIMSQVSPGAVSTAIYNMKKVVAQLSQGTTLRVIDGQAKPSDPKKYQLSKGKIAQFDLLDHNRIEIRVVSSQGDKPYVEVKPKNAEIKQTFRLTPLKTKDARDAQLAHSIIFNVQDDAEIFVSSISINEPAAKVNVKRLPVPRVSIKPVSQLVDPWPDERPLELLIDVEGENPLQLIRLLIKAEDQVHKELVSNIMVDDKFEVSTKYSLLLESYVQKDIATIEIVAEAVDRGLPNPLVGRSHPLILRTASAYGRYRETLTTLKELKAILDEARVNSPKTLDPAAQELMTKANLQAANSPFFDGLDRHALRIIGDDISALSKEMDPDLLLKNSEDLNQFLFEHETLDDRERDRDFFVATRSLSRLIEKPVKDRPLDARTVVDRLKSFLKERQARWTIRTKFIKPALVPKEWLKVKQGSFQKSLDRVADHSATDEGTEKALQELSQTVSDYRQWIETLEQAEDSARKQQEKKRQKGLADGRKMIRELQKRQSKISTKLDLAATKSQTDLKEQWSAIRMDQNANIKGTSSLEAQMRSLSPQAAERIKAAVSAMKQTVKSGNQDAFVQAESASDFAGRLLRQADSAASQSQKQQSRRGRRRRVVSDQYYGSSVAGGDVEFRREYEVNRRYREDVLEDVQKAKNNESADKQLLENYLRKVIR